MNLKQSENIIREIHRYFAKNSAFLNEIVPNKNSLHHNYMTARNHYLSKENMSSCKGTAKNNKLISNYMVSPRDRSNKENEPISKIPKLSKLTR